MIPAPPDTPASLYLQQFSLQKVHVIICKNVTKCHLVLSVLNAEMTRVRSDMPRWLHGDDNAELRIQLYPFMVSKSETPIVPVIKTTVGDRICDVLYEIRDQTFAFIRAPISTLSCQSGQLERFKDLTCIGGPLSTQCRHELASHLAEKDRAYVLDVLDSILQQK